MQRRGLCRQGLCLLTFWAGGVASAFGAPYTTTTQLTATIVASSCVGEIVTPPSQGRTAGTPGTVDFGGVNPQIRSAPAHPFSLRLSESMGGETGCSAFEAYGRQYPVATLSFGDIGHTQLDENGVILRYDDGSDARLRVRVSPSNVEGNFVQTGSPGYITSAYTELVYPIAFAAKGQFDFQAVLSQWDRVKPGRFNGSLTVTVVYR